MPLTAFEIAMGITEEQAGLVPVTPTKAEEAERACKHYRDANDEEAFLDCYYNYVDPERGAEYYRQRQPKIWEAARRGEIVTPAKAFPWVWVIVGIVAMIVIGALVWKLK